MTNETTTRSFPMTRVIISGLAAAFVALIIGLVAFPALADERISVALKNSLYIAAATMMVTILVQTVIFMMKGRR